MKENIRARKENQLKKAEAVLEIYKKYKQYDVPNVVIWRKHIYPVHFISLGQFNNYLGLNIEQERKKIRKPEYKPSEK